jgi:sugar lactone lactonase YvrE
VITSGPDGNLWFTEFRDRVGRMNVLGGLSEFKVPSGGRLGFIATGPDGNLWFAEDAANRIARITPAGNITEFPVPTASSRPSGIVGGPDGNLWFTEFAGNKVGQITTSGSITEFTIPTSGSSPDDIEVGPDGNLWFTEFFGPGIGRITTAGAITEFTIPTSGSLPIGIKAGPDGNLWFSEWQVNQIGRISTSGTFTEFPIATPNTGPAIVAAGPDGNLWFSQEHPNGTPGQIARVEANVPGIGYILSIDGGFAPGTRRILQGFNIQWSFYGATTMSVQDASGMALFASGARSAVSYYTFKFLGAGTYTYNDALKPSHAGTIAVPIAATPAAGTTTTSFTIKWASQVAPSGFVFDSEVYGPTDGDFVPLSTGQTAASRTFVPNEGAGAYFFRARLRKSSNGKHSNWSPTASISLS